MGRKGEPRNGREADGRRATVARRTRETDIELRLDLDAPDPDAPLAVGVPFFEHMLDALRTHGRLGLALKARGDLEVDAHHTVEDVGIALGTALREAVAAGGPIVRYGHAYAPLDESLARVVVDVCDRPFLHWGVAIGRPWVGSFDTDLVREFFHGLVRNGRITMHVDLLRGGNAHHEVECIFKAAAIALRGALREDPTAAGRVASTKGTLHETQARRRAAGEPATPEGRERTASPEGRERAASPKGRGRSPRTPAAKPRATRNAGRRKP